MTDTGLAAELPRAAGAPRMWTASAARSAEFTELYESTYREVSGYCAALLKDDSLAGDMAQEAFVRLFSRWRSVVNPRGFVFLVATNLVRDEWRRRSRQVRLLDAMRPLVDESAPDSDDSVIHDLIGRLSRPLRDVVVLHVVADLPVAEVARALGIPEGTVKRRLHDARARLRIDLKESS